jgi:hypothetical protein
MLFHSFLCESLEKADELAIRFQPETSTISPPHIDYIAKSGAMCFIVHNGGVSANEGHAHLIADNIVNVETSGRPGRLPAQAPHRSGLIWSISRRILPSSGPFSGCSQLRNLFLRDHSSAVKLISSRF